MSAIERLVEQLSQLVVEVRKVRVTLEDVSAALQVLARGGYRGS